MTAANAEIRPEQIEDDVRQVLRSAARGKGASPNYLTAYQILNRLRPEVRARLIAERGRGGRGEGSHFAATGVVMNALKRLGPAVHIVYLDTGGLQLVVDNETVEPGNRVCALYRIEEAG
jgi:hypothetical protein